MGRIRDTFSMRSTKVTGYDSDGGPITSKGPKRSGRFDRAVGRTDDDHTETRRKTSGRDPKTDKKKGR